MKNKISVVDFGTIHNGQKAHLFTVERENISFCVTDYGCCITSLNIRKQNGSFADVVLGLETLDGYACSWGSFGAVIGRYSNRIMGAKFSLNGKEYKLTENTEGACLHGGFPQWGNVLWRARPVNKKNASGICFSRTFADGEQGFPGNLNVEIEYLIDDNKQISMTYRAVTDQDTPISITNHSYFNLRGKETVHDYLVQLDAEKYLKLGEKAELVPVAGTEFDFTEERTLCDMRESSPRKEYIGYDVCYASKAYSENRGIPLEGAPLVRIGDVKDPVSGIKMSISSNQEGFQLYTAKYMNHIPGKNGFWYRPFEAVCIETQSFPDSPNQSHLPSTILHPGEKYEAKTVYSFSQKCFCETKKAAHGSLLYLTILEIIQLL